MEPRRIQHQASWRRISLLVASLLLGLTGCGADNPDVSSRPRADFEGSRFCEQYACRADDERALERGGLRRTYRIRDEDSLLIQLESWGPDVFSASIGLYGQEKLRSDFQDLATEFFASVIEGCRWHPVSLHADLTRRVSDLMEGRPHRCGPWELRAGRVGSDYIITAER